MGGSSFGFGVVLGFVAGFGFAVGLDDGAAAGVPSWPPELVFEPPDTGALTSSPVPEGVATVGVDGCVRAGLEAGFARGVFAVPRVGLVPGFGFVARGAVGKTGGASGSGAGLTCISGTCVRLGARRSTAALVASTPRTRKATTANLTAFVSCPPGEQSPVNHR
jgi:hypothetical protein